MYNNEERNNKDERPGMGEFYGGDKIKLTPVTNKQKFNRYHKPFSGKGEQLNKDNEVINDLPTYMLPNSDIGGIIETLKTFNENHISSNLNSNGLKKQSWYKEETNIGHDIDLLLPVANDYSKLQQEISHLKKIIRESNKDIKSLQNEVINLKKVNTSIIRKSNKDIESLEENQRILLNNHSILEDNVSSLKEELLSLITTIREYKNTNDVDDMRHEIDSIRGVLIDMSSQGCELCNGSIAGRCVYHGG